MGFGVFMVGQTVPNNFFKKIFSRKKTSVAKDSLIKKQNKPRIRVVKKPVVAIEEKTLTPTITCPLNQTVCLVNTTSYTHSGTSWMQRVQMMQHVLLPGSNVSLTLQQALFIHNRHNT
jgi:hypothetical protein